MLTKMTQEIIFISVDCGGKSKCMGTRVGNGWSVITKKVWNEYRKGKRK